MTEPQRLDREHVWIPPQSPDDISILLHWIESRTEILVEIFGSHRNANRIGEFCLTPTGALRLIEALQMIAEQVLDEAD